MKKLTKGKIITIVVVVLLFIGFGYGANGSTDDKFTVEWKEDEKYGEITFDLDGDKYSAASIKLNYYSTCAEYVRSLEEEDLNGYEYLRFIGLVKDENGKTFGRILGELPINSIELSDVPIGQDIEDNMSYLLLPDFLEEE